MYLTGIPQTEHAHRFLPNFACVLKKLCGVTWWRWNLKFGIDITVFFKVGHICCSFAIVENNTRPAKIMPNFHRASDLNCS